MSDEVLGIFLVGAVLLLLVFGFIALLVWIFGFTNQKNKHLGYPPKDAKDSHLYLRKTIAPNNIYGEVTCPSCKKLVLHPGYSSFRCTECNYREPSKRDLFPFL